MMAVAKLTEDFVGKDGSVALKAGEKVVVAGEDSDVNLSAIKSRDWDTGRLGTSYSVPRAKLIIR